MPSTQSRRLPELDLLRFVAASSVVFYHYTYRPAWQQGAAANSLDVLPAIFRFGFLGVPLFFMISGFVILLSSENRLPQEFVITRIARLYPSFWVCIFITAITVNVLSADRVSARSVALNLTMFPGLLHVDYIDGVYWTLFVELKFYFLIFILLVSGLIRYVHAWLYLWLVALVGAQTGLLPHIVASAAMQPYGAYFVSGSLLFVIHTRGVATHRMLALAVSCALCTWSGVRLQPDFMHDVTTATSWVAGSVIILIHLVMLAIVLKRIQLRRARQWYWLGSLTYPLYLLHNRMGKVLWGALPLSLSRWTDLFIVLGVVGAVSAVVAALVERRACSMVARGLLRGAMRLHLVPQPQPSTM